MKKMMMLTAFALMTVAVQAQTADAADATSKYSVETNSFWNNWFVSANATYNAFYTGKEHGMSDRPGLLDGSRSTMGVSVAVGKWFSPGLGLRTKVSGIWGRYVTPDENGSLKNKSHNSYKYWTAQEQMLFNIHNLFFGYNENRVWELIPYIGFGVTRNMTANDYAHGWSAGLLNTFNVTRRLAVNLELGLGLSDDELFSAATTNHHEYGTTIPGMDRVFSVELGLTYRLGKTGWKKSPDVEAIKALSQNEIDALNDRLRAAEADKAQAVAQRDAKIADLERALAAKPAAVNNAQPAAAKEAAANLLPVILFRQGQSVVDDSQNASLEVIAKYLKDNPNMKIQINGYASSEGTKEINNPLSTARAEAVRDILINRYKIAADRLTAKGFGPTDTLFDKVELNRVVTFSDTTK